MLFGIAILYARPAYRGTTRVPQPDGSFVTIRLVGDEYLHYNTTEDGFSLVRRDDGAYVYAQLNADFIYLMYCFTGQLGESIRRWSEQIEYSTENVSILLNLLA